MKFEPPLLVITQATTRTIYTEGGVIVIDKETGKIKKVVPEHPILESEITSIQAAHVLLSEAKKMKMSEGLQAEIAKYLVSITDIVTKKVTG